MFKRLFGIIMASLLLFNSGSVVYATSQFDEQFFNLNDIIYYDAGNEECISAGSISLSGSDNLEKIWNFFKSKGLPDEGVAGMIGGKWGETGGSLDPTVIESGQPYNEARAMSNESNYAFGIAQWDGERRPRLLNFAKEKGMKWDTLELQLEFMWHELNTGYTDVLDKLKSGSLEEAVKWWVGDYGWGYERPAAKHVGPRNAEGVRVGKELLAKFGGRSAPSSQSSSSSSSSGPYTFIGDSLTVGVKSQLESSFSGSDVRAQEGQGVQWALNQVTDSKDTVVINLGTNDKFENGSTLLEKLKDKKKVYLVNIYGVGGNTDYTATNTNIANAAKSFSNVEIISWKDYLDSNGGRDKYYAEDGYHMNEEGKKLYIKFLQDKLSGSKSSSSNSCSSSTAGGWNGNFGTSDKIKRTAKSGFPIYLQWDGEWANKIFNGGTYADTACVPTSTAMILTAMGKAITPEEIGEAMKSGGYLGSITQGAPVEASRVVEKYGFSFEEMHGNNIREYEAVIKSGGMIVLHGSAGPPPFYSRGNHAVVLYGISDSGKWLIANPNSASEEEDNTEWDPAFISQHLFAGGVIRKK